jgi:hypothetical protein
MKPLKLKQSKVERNVDLPDGLHEPSAASSLSPHTGGQAEALVSAGVI